MKKQLFKKNVNPQSKLNWKYFSINFISLGIISLLFSFFIDNNSWYFHTYFCIISILISFFHILKIIKLDFVIFLYDFRIIFLISYTFYFIIGASVLTFGTPGDIGILMNRFSIDAAPLALKIDAMNSIGFGLALLTYTFSKPIVLSKSIESFITCFNNINNLKLFNYITILGITTKGYVIANDLAVFGDAVVVPGIIRQLSQLSIAAILFSALYDGKRHSSINNISFLISILLSFFGLLGFSKTDFILPLIIFGVGTAIRKKSTFVLISTIFFGFVLIQLCGGIIQYARINHFRSMTLKNRFEIVSEGFQLANNFFSNSPTEDIQYSTLTRISYINAQSAAVHFYDEDNGSNDYKLLPFTFIPRILYSDKPILTTSGSELNYRKRMKKIPVSKHNLTQNYHIKYSDIVLKRLDNYHSLDY